MPQEGAEPAVYRMLVEQTRELLCLHDIDGTFRFVSPSVKAILGYTPGDLVGTHPLDLVHDDDRAAAEKALAELSDAPHARMLTLRFRHADGAYLYLEVQSRLLRGPSDRLEHIVSSSRDVSDRVALLRRATDAEAHMRSVLASFDDLVFVFDGGGCFLEYYQPRERQLATPAEDFLPLRGTPNKSPLADARRAKRWSRARLRVRARDRGHRKDLPSQGDAPEAHGERNRRIRGRRAGRDRPPRGGAGPRW